MPLPYEIRAHYDREHITIYQAYSPAIAELAIKNQKFVSPFSYRRMTWIKPSFLWLMHRCNWGQKGNQQKTLAVSIKRSKWDEALSLGVLTHFEPSIHRNADQWRQQFENAKVHIQWDTERNLRGNDLNHYSIQVGISRHLIREYAEQWIVKIEDFSSTVIKIRQSLRDGNTKRAKQLLPPERVYPVDEKIANRLMMTVV